jgi:hypothetical protein
VSEIKDHYQALVAESRYFGATLPRLRAAKELAIRLVLAPATCRVIGHDYECSADPENGSEEVWCNRCGYYHHARF